MILMYVLEISSKFKNESDSFEEGLIFKKKHHHLMKTFKNLKHDAFFSFKYLCEYPFSKVSEH